MNTTEQQQRGSAGPVEAPKLVTIEIQCPNGYLKPLGKRGFTLSKPLYAVGVGDMTRDEALEFLRREKVIRFPEWELVETWGSQPERVLVAVLDLIEADGHTIFKPEAFLAAGVPESLVKRSTTVYESGKEPKETIFEAGTGKPLPELEGVYGLSVLGNIQAAIGADGSCAMGRGFAARQLDGNIRRKLASYH